MYTFKDYRCTVCDLISIFTCSSIIPNELNNFLLDSMCSTVPFPKIIRIPPSVTH